MPRSRTQLRHVGPLAGCLTIGLLALGGVTPETQWLISVAVLVLVVWSLRHHCWYWTPLSSVLLALAVYTALYTVPVPARVVAGLCPECHEVWTTTFGLLGEQRQWLPLALEPGADLNDAYSLSLCAVYAACATGLLRNRGSASLTWALTSATVLLAISSVIHALFNAKSVFGVYHPRNSSFVAPLLNANNLSGVLNLGAFTAAGLFWRDRASETRRAVAGGSFLLLVAASLLTGSRGGLLGLMLGTLVMAGVMLWRRRLSNSRSLSDLWVWLGLCAIAAGFAAFSLQRLKAEWLDDSLTKLQVIRAGFRAVLESPWVGFGRGAFAQVVSPEVPDGSHVVYDYAENIVLEAAVGWGVLVALAALIALIYCLWPRRLVPRDWGVLGAAIGFGLWLLQNLVDFGSEILGVRLAVLTAAAAVMSLNHAKQAKRPTWLLLTVPAVLAGAVFVRKPEPARAARARVASAAVSKVADAERLRRALERHPADPFLIRAGALNAVYANAPNALKWVNYALRRAPKDARNHLLLAWELQRHGASKQALGALKRAAELDAALAPVAAKTAFRWAPEEALNIVPEGKAGPEYLRVLAEQQSRTSVKITLLLRASHLGDAKMAVWEALVTTLLVAEDADCEKAEAMSCAQLLAANIERLAPGPWRRVFEAELELLRGDALGAYTKLSADCGLGEARQRCHGALLRAAQKLDLDKHTLAAERLLNIQCGNSEHCAQTENVIASSFANRGEYVLALEHARRAARMQPSIARWKLVAKYALAARQPQNVRRAVDKITKLGGSAEPEVLDGMRRLLLERHH